MMREMADALPGGDALSDVLDHANQVLRIPVAIRDQHFA